MTWKAFLVLFLIFIIIQVHAPLQQDVERLLADQHERCEDIHAHLKL